MLNYQQAVDRLAKRRLAWYLGGGDDRVGCEDVAMIFEKPIDDVYRDVAARYEVVKQEHYAQCKD